MAQNIIYRNSVNGTPSGINVVSVPASGKLAVLSPGGACVSQWVNFPTLPAKKSLVGYAAPGVQFVTSAFTSAATLTIDAYGFDVWYEVGTAPVVQLDQIASGTMPTAAAAGTLNATGTLTAALMLGQVVTSSTAAAVTATLDTGAILDAATSFNIGDWFEFIVVNTGGANAFTVTTATGWTLVGAMAVAANTSGRFRVAKTAAATFTCWRS